MSLIKEFNNHDGLPKGWYRAKINDLIGPSGVFIDGDWVESKDQNPNGEIRLIQLADIGDGFFRDRSDRFMDHSRAVELNCTFLEKDDVLIARMPDPLGRACLFPFSEKIKYVTVVDVAIIRPGNELVLPKLIMNFINAPRFRHSINELQSGTTRKRISRGNLSTLDFPLPPLPEQHRIVEKLDRLFARLARAEAALAAAETALERYRQSVLNTAFKAEDEKGNLKEGWKYMKLETLGTWNGGGTPSKQNQAFWQNGDILWVSPKDMKSEKITETEDKITKAAIENSSTKLIVPPSVLFVVRSGILRRILPVATTEIPVTLNQDMQAFSPNEDQVLAKYVYWYCIVENNTILRLCSKSGTTVESLETKILKAYKIPLPTLEVQNKIVLQVESAMNRASSLRSGINQLRTECTRLRQSILQEAFGGRLVPQVASDEPASALIERIKSAREKQERSNKQRGKSPSKNIEKKMAKVKEGQPILDIIRASNGSPVKAQTVWLQSEFKDSIDKFYDALKVLIEVEKTIKETRDGDITYLILNDENR